MTEKHSTEQKIDPSVKAKEILQQMHDQGVIDLDAPMRQLFAKMEASGDVGGYMKIESPEEDSAWVLATAHYVFAGDDLKDPAPTKLR